MGEEKKRKRKEAINVFHFAHRYLIQGSSRILDYSQLQSWVIPRVKRPNTGKNKKQI